MSDNNRDPMQSQWDNVNKRDEIFTEIVENFANHQKENNEQKNNQKNVFFWMVCISFVVVVIGCIAAILVVALKEKKSVEDLGVVVGSVASLISVIIVLPSKIAENLFPSDGEKDFATFFINTHRDDIEISKNKAPDGADEENKDEDTYSVLAEFVDDDEA